jgi:hypothetical protein
MQRSEAGRRDDNGPDGSFGYRLWDPETHQVVRSSDVVFNESVMHKSADRPIELRRVTFSDVTTPLDGPAQHTRSASRSVDPLDEAVSTDHPSSSATTGLTRSDETSSQVRSTIAPEPASPVVPRRSEQMSQPPERYSPGLFFTDAGEPMTYREAMEATNAASWPLAMESEMDSIRANGTWDLVKLLRNRTALPCKWVYRLKQVPPLRVEVLWPTSAFRKTLPGRTRRPSPTTTRTLAARLLFTPNRVVTRRGARVNSGDVIQVGCIAAVISCGHHLHFG